MIKDILKEKEKIAYLTLAGDLRNDTLANCYLLHGDLNPLKKDTAFLLAQSIIEGKRDFACETCDTCRRIKELKYFDLIYIDGYKNVIKVEDIQRILDEFTKTSLESFEKKIYIINNANNATVKALNMLLKFMEESSSNTYGIFISDNIDTLLNTIVSRCKKIPFVSKDYSLLMKEYENLGYSSLNAYLLSNIKHELLNDEDLLDNLELAKELAYKMIDNLDNKEYLPVLFNREFISVLSKEKVNEIGRLFIDVMIMMLDDSIDKNYIDDEEYLSYLNRIDRKDFNKLYEAFLKAKDNLKYVSCNGQLFDQIAFEIIL